MKPKTFQPKRMFSAAKKANELELLVYDVIGEDFFGSGVTPESVQQAIKDAGEISKITVRINSPGGDSFDGVAIHNIIRQQKVPVDVIVEGLAASAAFTIAMAGDSIQVCDGAMMMLHNAWGMAIGNAASMREMADLLEKHSGGLRDMYAKRSGMKAQKVQGLMDAETWLTPQEAVENGFATEAMSTTKEAADNASALVAEYDLSKFCAKVPKKFRADKQDGDGDAPLGPPPAECECSCKACLAGEHCMDDASGCHATAVPPGPPGEPKSQAECECECAACESGDCASCTMSECDDPNCVHDPAERPDSLENSVDPIRERRLQLAEMTQPSA